MTELDKKKKYIEKLKSKLFTKFRLESGYLTSDETFEKLEQISNELVEQWSKGIAPDPEIYHLAILDAFNLGIEDVVKFSKEEST